MVETIAPDSSLDALEQEILDIVDSGSWDGEMSRLKELTFHKSESIRDLAAWALGQCPLPEASEILMSLVSSPHPEVRDRALIALVERDHPQGCALLADLLGRERDPGVLATIAAAIGDLDCKSLATKALSMSRTLDLDLGYEFALAAARLGLTEAAQELARHSSNPRRAFEVAELLIALGDPSVVPIVKKSLNGFLVPPEIRIPGATVLAFFGDESHKKYLLKKSSSWFIEVRLMAVHFLGFLSTTWAKERLEELTRSKDSLVKEAAQTALSRNSA